MMYKYGMYHKARVNKPPCGLRAAFISAVYVCLFGLSSNAIAQVLEQKGEQTTEQKPQVVVCSDAVPKGTTCWRGKDSAGAPYLIAMPEKWSGVLVVHAHGGPSLGAPTDARTDEDLKRWSITVHQGHAWVGSAFRQGGFAVTAAAQDTERVRKIFVGHVAKPRRTILHGQSWGAMVATKAGELFAQSWDGILLTSGVVAGPATYDFRLDLRVLYQYYCSNHPLPSEPSYPLSLGLPSLQSKLSNAEIAERANECLGVSKPAVQRSVEQRQRLKAIATILKIPESSVLSHLNWGTGTLADIVHKRLGGVSPFGNVGVRYVGSLDDVALNANVLRYSADPKARDLFIADTDHAGRFNVPVLTAHGIGDATVFVEGSDTLRERMVKAGTIKNLTQTFVQSSEHSYWGDAHYPPLFDALIQWIEKGEKPTAVSVENRCKELNVSSPNQCRFDSTYNVQPLSSRVYPR
jgi:pimeloyl-ACP methyl ester carboxylesterase